MVTEYDYNPDLPYVVEREGEMVARFAEPDAAEHFASQRYEHKVIDTTPKPRVPDDAKYITWEDGYARPWFALRVTSEGRGWRWRIAEECYALENLPGVTPETVFTVLDERGTHE